MPLRASYNSEPAPPPAKVRMHADIAAVIPIALRLVMAVESAVDNLLEAVPGVLKVEINEEARAQANDAIPLQGDKIAFGEEPAVIQKVRLAHQLAGAQGGKTIALQLLKSAGMARLDRLNSDAVPIHALAPLPARGSQCSRRLAQRSMRQASQLIAVDRDANRRIQVSRERAGLE